MTNLFCFVIFCRFKAEIESGLIDIISPPESFYPDLNNLRETFGDPAERVK